MNISVLFLYIIDYLSLLSDTFSLIYDDGEVELKVKATSIRLPAGSASVIAPEAVAVEAPKAVTVGNSGGAAKLAVGTKVEGLFRER